MEPSKKVPEDLLFGGHCWRSWRPRSLRISVSSVSSSYLAHISRLSPAPVDYSTGTIARMPSHLLQRLPSAQTVPTRLASLHILLQAVLRHSLACGAYLAAVLEGGEVSLGYLITSRDRRRRIQDVAVPCAAHES